MKHEFKMALGNTTTYAILEDISFFGSRSFIRAKQVAEPIGFTEDGRIAYRKCKEKSFVAVGPFILVEYTGKIEE